MDRNNNSGNYNSGHYNSGNHNSGFFNTTTPALRLFNKDTGLTMDDLDIPFIDLKINEWKNEKELTKEDKKNSVKWDVNKGVLITRSYHEAWKLYWRDASEEDKNKFLSLPNFDADIFKEITGIDVVSKQETSCNNKSVIIDGKKYKLVEEK